VQTTLQIPDEIDAEARKKGLPIETYVQQLLARHAPATTNGGKPPHIPEEISAWLSSLARFSEIPALPETITREWIYQEHN